MPTVTVTFSAEQGVRIQDATQAKLNLGPKAAVIQYLKNLVVEYEYEKRSKETEEAVREAKRQVPTPSDVVIT